MCLRSCIYSTTVYFHTSLVAHLIDHCRPLFVQNQNSVIDNDVDYWQYEVYDEIGSYDKSNYDGQMPVLRYLYGVSNFAAEY